MNEDIQAEVSHLRELLIAERVKAEGLQQYKSIVENLLTRTEGSSDEKLVDIRRSILEALEAKEPQAN